MLLLKRAAVALVIFVVLLIGIPATFLYLRGELSSQRATGLGAVASSNFLIGVVIVFLVSVALSVFLIRD